MFSLQSKKLVDPIMCYFSPLKQLPSWIKKKSSQKWTIQVMVYTHTHTVYSYSSECMESAKRKENVSF